MSFGALRWLRPSALIDEQELSALEEALQQYYASPPPGYQEEAARLGEDLSKPEHVFHQRIISLAQRHWKVLDVGCGPAVACRFFRERGADYTGIDLASGQLEINRRRYPDARFMELHWRDFSKIGTQFDVVTSFFVLEHIVRPREFLQSSASLVRPGGYLAVLCPNFLDARYLPSQYCFGETPGGLKGKIRGRRWPEAIDEAWCRYVKFPLFVRGARRLAAREGVWIINLRPVCLNSSRWGLDWDAVYMVSEDEVGAYMERLGFEIVERGDRWRRADAAAGYPDFCYVVGRKTEC